MFFTDISLYVFFFLQRRNAVLELGKCVDSLIMVDCYYRKYKICREKFMEHYKLERQSMPT